MESFLKDPVIAEKCCYLVYDRPPHCLCHLVCDEKVTDGEEEEEEEEEEAEAAAAEAVGQVLWEERVEVFVQVLWEWRVEVFVHDLWEGRVVEVGVTLLGSFWIVSMNFCYSFHHSVPFLVPR